MSIHVSLQCCPCYFNHGFLVCLMFQIILGQFLSLFLCHFSLCFSLANLFACFKNFTLVYLLFLVVLPSFTFFSLCFSGKYVSLVVLPCFSLFPFCFSLVNLVVLAILPYFPCFPGVIPCPICFPSYLAMLVPLFFFLGLSVCPGCFSLVSLFFAILPSFSCFCFLGQSRNFLVILPYFPFFFLDNFVFPCFVFP